MRGKYLLRLEVSTQGVFACEFFVAAPGCAVGEGSCTFEFLGGVVEFHMSLPIMLSCEVLLTMRTHMRSFILMRQHMSPNSQSPGSQTGVTFYLSFW